MSYLTKLINKLVEIQTPGATKHVKERRRSEIVEKFKAIPLEKKAAAIKAAEQYIACGGDVSKFLREGRQDDTGGQGIQGSAHDSSVPGSQELHADGEGEVH
jgi:hypothetical protein